MPVLGEWSSYTLLTMYICGTQLELLTHFGRTPNIEHGHDFYNRNLPVLEDISPRWFLVVSRVGNKYVFCMLCNKISSKFTTILTTGEKSTEKKDCPLAQVIQGFSYQTLLVSSMVCFRSEIDLQTCIVSHGTVVKFDKLFLLFS